MSRLWDRWWLAMADPWATDKSNDFIAKYVAIWGGAIILCLVGAIGLALTD